MMTYGKEIIIRSNYLPDISRAFTLIIKVLSFIEIILLGIAYRKYKFESVLYFLLIVLISLGTGSRVVFLFLLIYFSILFISQGNKTMNKIKFSINIFISILFLAYLMQLRGLSSHGILPYLKNLTAPEGNFLRDFYFNIYYSLIFGFYVTIRTLQEAQFDWNIIFISLNPLPGTLTGWYDYAETMRVNIFAPYTLHGRIFKMGMPFTICYFLTTGILFGLFEKKIRSFLNSGHRVLALVLLLLVILYIVYGFEYNLRSAFRYIYYALFVIFINYLYRLLKPYIIKKLSD
jgi:hypothetical protein